MFEKIPMIYCLFGAIASFIVGVRTLIKIYHFSKCSVKTEGVITDMKIEQVKRRRAGNDGYMRDTVCVYNYKYSDDSGNEYNGRVLSRSDNAYKTGDIISICYIKNNPKSSRLEEKSRHFEVDKYLAVTTFLISFVFIILVILQS